MRDLLLVTCFFPITVGTLEVNYLFLLLLPAFTVSRRDSPALMIFVMGMAYYVIAYLTGAIVYFSDLSTWEQFRQFLSFGAFATPFLLLVVDIPGSPRRVFRAVSIAAVTYSVWILVMFVLNFGQFTPDLFRVKSGMRDFAFGWPQRYSVLLVFALFYFFDKLSDRAELRDAIAAVLVAIVLIMTFTRTVYISVLAGSAAVVLAMAGQRILRWLGSRQAKGGVLDMLRFAVLIGGPLCLILAWEPAGNALGSVANRTWGPLFELYGGDVAGGSVEGRIAKWQEALDILEQNPLTGTGFAGIYIFESNVGSAHGQYLDVLLRTGIMGLVFYVGMWIIVLLHFLRKSAFIFGGLTGIAVFGFAHETTKLPYVAVLFFLLLRTAANHMRVMRREPTASRRRRVDVSRERV